MAKSSLLFLQESSVVDARLDSNYATGQIAVENPDLYLGPCQTSMMELLYENNMRLKASKNFHKKFYRRF